MKEIGSVEFDNRINGFKSLVIDIGTGEGEFVYRKARQNREAMFIGVDSAAAAMLPYSIKAAKKTDKGGLSNLMYVVANAEALPDTLYGKADKIFINLPWGSLRDGIIKGEPGVLKSINKIAKANASLEICISYCDFYEKQVIKERGLPTLSISYISDKLKYVYNNYGISINKVSVLSNEDLKKMNTKWAKKLGYGKQREVFYLSCIIKK
jgi:16S rRNA (adenine(1408)-N(1))-methyltransferase